MMEWKEYNDAHSSALVMAFRDALEPLMVNVAPDWLLHHIELARKTNFDTLDECVEIRLIIKPIGTAKLVNPNRLTYKGLTREQARNNRTTAPQD